MFGFELITHGVFRPGMISISYRPEVTVCWGNEEEAYISRTWDLYAETSRNAGLAVYNGSLFRLEGSQVRNGGLYLQLSHVDFRSYVGTALPGFAAAFPHAPRANPLAVCAALVTRDGKIVIEKRKYVDAYRGLYHVIGGFVETGVDIENGVPDPFLAIRREVLEELGARMPRELISTGLVRTSMGSELCFSCPLDLGFDELLSGMGRGNTDAEIGQLLALPDDSRSVSLFLKERQNDMVPSGMACLFLHGRYHYAEGWYGRTGGELSC